MAKIHAGFSDLKASHFRLSAAANNAKGPPAHLLLFYAAEAHRNHRDRVPAAFARPAHGRPLSHRLPVWRRLAQARHEGGVALRGPETGRRPERGERPGDLVSRLPPQLPK